MELVQIGHRPAVEDDLRRGLEKCDTASSSNLSEKDAYLMISISGAHCRMN
jgi:hypothetical protein